MSKKNSSYSSFNTAQFLARHHPVIFSCHTVTLNFWDLLLQCRSNFVHTLTPNFYPFTATPSPGLMIIQITVWMQSFVLGTPPKRDCLNFFLGGALRMINSWVLSWTISLMWYRLNQQLPFQWFRLADGVVLRAGWRSFTWCGVPSSNMECSRMTPVTFSFWSWRCTDFWGALPKRDPQSHMSCAFLFNRAGTHSQSLGLELGSSDPFILWWHLSAMLLPLGTCTHRSLSWILHSSKTQLNCLL